MRKKRFSVPNISCTHCVRTIENELSEIDGVLSVKGDAREKCVSVSWDDPATEQNIKARLSEIGYPAEG